MATRHEQLEAADELENFREIASVLRPSPGGIPRLEGVDIYGMSIPLSHGAGGDHIIYIDFNKRYDMPRRIAEAEAESRPDVADRLRDCCHRAGILLADVSGHKATDALIAAMMHQAFLTGVYYELDRYGEVTTRLFEHLNQRFYRTTTVNKYLTMIYGEISDEGRFRFISAGHPRPMVFSREFGEFVEISDERMVSYPPVGMFPSKDLSERVQPSRLGYKKPYTVNEIDLLAGGDLLFLYTDGLSEHAAGKYFPQVVEKGLAGLDDESAQSVCERLRDDLMAYEEPQDDISFVVIRKT